MKITVRLNEKTVREINLAEGKPVTVGRQPDNDIVLNEIKASRHHGRFVLSAGAVSYEDLGSGNGTFVKGSKIEAGKPIALAAGDEIAIGAALLYAEEGEAIDPATVTAAAAAPREPAKVAAGMTGELSASGGEVDGKKFGLGNGEITIGRTPENCIQIMDPLSSRSNAAIRRDGEVYKARDLGSTNGTFLNQQKLTAETALCAGDEVRIGAVRFVFAVVPEAAAAPVPQPKSGAAPEQPVATAGEPAPQGKSALLVPAALVALVVICFFIWKAFLHDGGQPTPPNGAAGTGGETKPAAFPVALGEPKLLDVDVSLEKTGDVRPWKQGDHLFATGLKVEEVYVENNQRVKAGDKLLKFELSDSLSAARNKARAAVAMAGQEVAKAESALANARDNQKIAQESFDKNQPLFERGNLLRQEWDAVRTKLNNATTDTEVKQKSLEQAQEKARQAGEDMKEVEGNVDDLTVKAKIDGLVSGLNLKKGYAVTPENNVVSIIEFETEVKVVVPVPEDDISLVREGNAAQVWLSKAPERRFAGTVSLIPATATNRNYDVEVRTPNADKYLRPGAQALVRFVVETRKGALCVPASCLASGRSGEFYLFKYDPAANAARQVTVKRGAEKDEGGVKYVEVDAGNNLAVTDKIVVDGYKNLRDGAAVEPKK